MKAVVAGRGLVVRGAFGVVQRRCTLLRARAPIPLRQCPSRSVHSLLATFARKNFAAIELGYPPPARAMHPALDPARACATLPAVIATRFHNSLRASFAAHAASEDRGNA
jgi:hypothetical protein